MDKAGLLIDGYDELKYNDNMVSFSLSKKHLKELGLEKLAEWVEYKIKIFSEEDAPEKLKKFASIIQKDMSCKY